MAAEATRERRSGPDAGCAKAAALLEKLGMQAAGEVLKHLSPAEVEKVARTFAQMREMPSRERQKLGEEALEEIGEGGPAEPDLMQFARELLGEQLGPDAAQRLLGGGLATQRVSASLDWVGESAAGFLAEALAEENPRITAVVLAALRSGLAARVLAMLPTGLRGDVLLHLAGAQSPTPEATALILDRVVTLLTTSEAAAEGPRAVRAPELRLGTGKVADILRQCDRTTERGVMDYLQEHASEIAHEVSQSIFSDMQDLKWLDARSIQTVLRELETRDLARALRGTPEELQKLCFDNLSENAAAELREELEALGPTPRREVETAQQAVLELVRSMLEQERIQVAQEAEDLI